MGSSSLVLLAASRLRAAFALAALTLAACTGGGSSGTVAPPAAPPAASADGAVVTQARKGGAPTPTPAPTPSQTYAVLTYQGVSSATEWYYQGGAGSCPNSPSFVPGSFSTTPKVVGTLSAGTLVTVYATLYDWQNNVLPSNSCPDHMTDVTQVVVGGATPLPAQKATPAAQASAGPASSPAVALAPVATSAPTSSASSISVSASNYVNITNVAPVPANFVAYSATSPWNVHVPAAPQNVDTTNTPIVQAYARNTGATNIVTEAQNYLSGCSGACGGIGGYPIYKAGTSDPSVTLSCVAWTSQQFGCTQNDGLVNGFTVSGHIPANARPGCTDANACGDINMAVIQPDGTTWNIYGCNPSRNFQNGDVVGNGGTVCGAWGLVVANITTSLGVNSSVTSGDNYEAHTAFYNEVVNNSIAHALEFPVSCVTGYVYPAQGQPYSCPSGGGTPAGTHIHLRLTHAQIDSLISSKAFIPAMRAFYYALSDYGGYIIDTSGGSTPQFVGGPALEDARPWISNGTTNPWVSWFQSQGATQANSQDGNPFLYLTQNFWAPMAPYLEALSTCYAKGTCTT